MPATTQTPLYLSDVFTGLFATLAKKNVHALSLVGTRIEDAVRACQPTISEYATKNNMPLGYHIGSSDIEREIVEAKKRGIASTEMPPTGRLHIDIRPDEADLFLQHLPLPAEIYENAAIEFLRRYNSAIK